MSFPQDYYVAGFLSALVCSVAALPFWRRFCRSWGLVDEPGKRKMHAAPVPLAGGLGVLTGLVAPLLAGALVIGLGWAGGEAGEWLAHGLSVRAPQLGAIVLGALGMVLLGLWDDWKELRPAVKFAGQLVIAGLVAGAGVRITLFVPSLVFSYAITILWILTVTNALNFMDNMNGLCSGVGLIASAFFGLTAALNGQYLVALLSWTVCGALAGFLPYNFPRASAFLGDSGSHLTGYLLAVLAILPHFYTGENQSSWAVLSPLFILAIPLADLVWVVWIRFRLKQPFYVGDTNHLSHRLERRGWSKPRAVGLIWLAGVVLGGVTLFF